jgi:hypothetical protein
MKEIQRLETLLLNQQPNLFIQIILTLIGNIKNVVYSTRRNVFVFY